MTKTTKAPRPKGSAAKKSTPAPAAPSLLPDPSTVEPTGLTLAEAEAKRWPLGLLTAPGYFQAHTAYSGVGFLRTREGSIEAM